MRSSSILREALGAPTRLDALHRTGVLETSADVFVRHVRLAARLLSVPIVLVSLVDDCRQLVKAAVGEAPTLFDLPASGSFCAHVVASGLPLRVEDARLTELRSTYPVTDLDVVAYLGVPLFAPGGEALGALCAMDKRPRAWTADELAALEDVASVVSGQIESLERARTLSLVFDAGADALWDLDLQTGVTRWTAQVDRMLGYAPGELVPSREAWESRVHPDDLATLRGAMTAHLEGRTAQYIAEYRLRNGNRGWTWLRSRGRVVRRSPDGRPLRVAGRATNIDAERRDRELRMREARLAGMGQPVSEIEIVASLDGRILEANDPALAAYGYTREEMRGCMMRDLCAPEVRGQHAERSRAIAAGSSLRFETAHVRRDGARFPVEISARTFSVDGETYIHRLIRDLSASRDAEAPLQHATKLESLGVLAGGIAHDFNNLLVAVLTNAHFALEELPAGAPARESIEEVRLAAERAAELTKQLLVYAGRTSSFFARLRLGPILEAAASKVSDKVTVHCSVEQDLPWVDGDAAQLRQMIASLVTNAAEAVAGGGTVTVSLRAIDVDAACAAGAWLGHSLQPGRHVALVVEDSGVGMSTETQARIFDPFFTTKFAGRGLGLAATLGILRAHKGAVRVDSIVGRGSRFEVLLPAVSSPERLSDASSLAGGTLLVVDDEAHVRRAVKRGLERSGFRVVEASDGVEGLERYLENADRIRAVVVDVTMPRMSGIEMVRRLRSFGSTVGVVVVSGYTDDDLRSTLAELAPVEFIEKPFIASDLLNGVRTALAKAEKASAFEPVRSVDGVAFART